MVGLGSVRTLGLVPAPRHGLELAQDVTPEEGGEDGLLRDVDPIELSELADPRTFLELVRGAFADVLAGVADRVPWLLVALAVLVALLLAGRLLASVVNRGMRRTGVDFAVRRLVVNLLRLGSVGLALLVSLSIAGVEVGAALAAIGLVGLALAFALQNILENQISGVLILLRKPFVRGDLILTNGYEGYVEDIDLRVTTLREHDGLTTMIPNAHVLTNSLTNFTRRGTRRTTVTIGIDYRDDHDRAREVLRDAVVGVEGVLEDPPHEVLLVGLGDSSVDVEVRFWTAADNKMVRQTRDRVLAACKSAVEAAGMTIPWPIRTLAADRVPLAIDLGSGTDRPAADLDGRDGGVG